MGIATPIVVWSAGTNSTLDATENSLRHDPSDFSFGDEDRRDGHLPGGGPCSYPFGERLR